MRENAWKEIEKREYEDIWNKFEKEFHFKPKRTPVVLPSIKEPRPSETYSISHIYGCGATHYEKMNNDLMNVTLSMFKQLVIPDDWIYALDWYHPAYRFFPHVPFELDEFREWQVPILPDGDYYIFLEKNFIWGVFGQPWEQTMCFWAKELLEFLHENKPLLLTHLVREKK